MLLATIKKTLSTERLNTYSDERWRHDLVLQILTVGATNRNPRT